MYVKQDITALCFEPWAGAFDHWHVLTFEQREKVWDALDHYYSELGVIPTETEINDLLWFEEDFIASLLGYESWEELEESEEDQRHEYRAIRYSPVSVFPDSL